MQVYVIHYSDSFESDIVMEVIEINPKLLESKVRERISLVLESEGDEFTDDSPFQRNGNDISMFAEGWYTYDGIDGVIDVTLHEVQR